MHQLSFWPKNVSESLDTLSMLQFYDLLPGEAWTSHASSTALNTTAHLLRQPSRFVTIILINH